MLLSNIMSESDLKQNNTKEKFGIAQAIIIAGLIIAFAIFISNWKPSEKVENQPSTNQQQTLLEKIRPPRKEDHILGDFGARIFIIEFSDLECPFCKLFHSTMLRIVNEYGKDGRVAWIYRHFPLDSIHPKARTEAEATECAAELGGNDAFWKYVDKIFEITPSNNGLDLGLLPKIAAEIGLNQADFEQCLNTRKHRARVEEDANEAIAIGARGTPFSVIISGNKKVPIFGAMPYDNIKRMIEELL